MTQQMLSPPVTRGGTRRHLPPKPAPLDLTGGAEEPGNRKPRGGGAKRNKAATPAEIPVQAVLNAAYAAALACRWYKMYVPPPTHTPCPWGFSCRPVGHGLADGGWRGPAACPPPLPTRHAVAWYWL